MVQEHEALISEFSHESHRPRAADALHTLRKIASLVKPIMRQRGWRVGTLAEFYPDQRNLLGLNVNRGQKICLRLRYPSDHNQFLPIEQVVDTMLHELSHNVFGPHDQKFHALWDQLRDEYEALLRKGYTGEGFLSKGQRLGGSTIGGGVPLEEARRQARAAALKRKQRAGLAASSGQKLGGRPVGWQEDIREVIAGAADRRRATMAGCGSTTVSEAETRKIVDEASKNGFKTRAEEDAANERAIMQAYMELVQEEEKERLGEAYVEASPSNPAGSRGTSSKLPAAGTRAGGILPPPPPIPTATKPSTPTISPPFEPNEPTASSFSPNWTCEICTLVNQPNHLCCDACGVERPSFGDSASLQHDQEEDPTRRRQKRPPSSSSASRSKAARSEANSAVRPRGDRETVERIFAAAEAQKQKPIGWLCDGCGNFMEREYWTCARCGRMKSSS